MNLRAIANGAITSVNPNLPAVLKLNDGYTTDATGKRKSGYSEHSVSGIAWATICAKSSSGTLSPKSSLKAMRL